MAKRTGLGKGLDALIRDVNGTKETPEKAETAKKPAVKTQAAKKTAAKTETTKKTAAKTEATKKPASKAEAAKKPAAKAEAPKKTPSKAEKVKKTAPKSPETPEVTTEKGERIVRLALVEPNRDQPRKTFTDASIEELADSIRQFGVIQPLLVQAKGDHYEIIAGERRWRAARKAGLKEIPILVRDYSTREAVEVSLIENIQREDLNPIEEAKAYRNLMGDYSLTQDDVAKRVSKSRAAVANSLRLLKLDQRVQDMVIDNKMSEGHARALLALEEGDRQVAVAEEIIKEHMSVRQAEQLVRKLLKPTSRRTRTVDPQREAVILSLTEKLKSVLGTKVEINRTSGKKGRIEIEYYSDDDLERLYDLLMTISDAQ